MLLTLAGPAPQSSAATFTSKAVATAGMYPCTSTAPTCESAMVTMPSGSPVHMLCWRDERTATVKYRSNRWFYVTLPNGHEGFVHSSAVTKQTTVGNCSGDREVTATSPSRSVTATSSRLMSGAL
jgi:hypothetical protein